MAISHYSEAGVESQGGKFAVQKRRSLRYSESLERIGELNAADRVRQCGTSLTLAFPKGAKSGRLVGANFCRDRLCPMCAWRHSVETFGIVSAAMDKVISETEATPIFLTLTVKNCQGEKLPEALDQIFTGWNRLMAPAQMRETFSPGWFRALEITYNDQTGEYHPHLHAIMLARKDYFNGRYIPQEEWCCRWKKAARLDYDPIGHVELIKDGRKGRKEVSKYTVKAEDYLFRSPKKTDDIVCILRSALRGRRLHAFGGLFKAEAAAVKSTKKAELSALRADIGQILVSYRWVVGLSAYRRVDMETGGIVTHDDGSV